MANAKEVVESVKNNTVDTKDELKAALEEVAKAEEKLKKIKQEAIKKEKEIIEKQKSNASIKELLEASRKIDSNYDVRGHRPVK